MGDLRGVEAKLDRAKYHLVDLRARLDATYKPEAGRFVLERDPDSAKHFLKVYDVPAIPDEWLTIIGDCIHNIRASLDLLAWQVVESAGIVPTQNTEFPVRKDPLNRKGKFLIPSMPPLESARVSVRLAELQPYIQFDGRLADGSQSILWAIHRLNIIDKHRLLLVLVSTLDTGGMYWAVPPEPIPDFGVYRVIAEEGTNVAWFDFKGSIPPPEFNCHPSLHVVLNEAEFPHLANSRVDHILELLISHVKREIIPRFEEFL